MIYILLLAFITKFDRGESIYQRVDLIEYNHYYSDEKHSFDQVIFYEWAPDYKRMHVIAWMLVEQSKDRIPKYDTYKKEYYIRFFDKDGSISREIRSKCFIETWKESDPERINKQFFQEKHRRGLIKR